jgi:hypothetical protein
VDLDHGAAEQRAPGTPRFGGLTVPDPAFSGDDGSADPSLSSALAAYDEGTAYDADLVEALRGRRLMVPLLAVLDGAEQVGPGDAPPVGEKDSHMASVSLLTPDGRRGLLAFTSVSAMAAWDPAARGIPATAETVATAALEEGAHAVLVDLAGPVRLVLTGVPMEAVATGRALPPAYDDPEVRAAVAGVLDASSGVARADLQPGPQGPDGALADLLLVLVPEPDADAASVAEEVARALASDPLLARRCGAGIAVGMAPG